MREKLPDERASLTHCFHIRGEKETYKGYITVGFYPDGRPGEVFVKMDRQGSTVSGFIDAWSIAMSMNLQLGMSLHTLCAKFRGMSFDPAGFTDNPEIRIAKSPIDYIARWLDLRFCDCESDTPVVSLTERTKIGVPSDPEIAGVDTDATDIESGTEAEETLPIEPSEDAPFIESFPTAVAPVAEGDTPEASEGNAYEEATQAFKEAMNEAAQEAIEEAEEAEETKEPATNPDRPSASGLSTSAPEPRVCQRDRCTSTEGVHLHAGKYVCANCRAGKAVRVAR